MTDFLSARYETLELERLDPTLLVIRMNRPAAANAMNTQMGLDLMTIFETLQIQQDGLRCVVLTGTGERAFCAGGDLVERRTMSDVQWQAQHAIFERMVRAVINCPLPLVAAVNGAAVGGGCEIAAACDFVYAARHARFALTEVTLGIMPGAGGTQNLARAVGTRRQMSGIFGLVRRDGAPVADALATMRAAMPRWGPDGFGEWCERDAALGQARLIATPESRFEDLPAWDGAAFSSTRPFWARASGSSSRRSESNR